MSSLSTTANKRHRRQPFHETEAVFKVSLVIMNLEIITSKMKPAAIDKPFYSWSERIRSFPWLWPLKFKRSVWGLAMLTAAYLSYPGNADAQNRAAWMQKAKWGVMTHYLADWQAREHDIEMNVEKWNEMIDHFDVKGLANQLHEVGAGYYLLTLGQNSGYYLSPNATYDRLVGIEPSKLSRRDLVADMYEALKQYDIKLMVYLPSGAPGGDREAREKLQWRRGPYRNKEFQMMWQDVISEWSRRWGDKVSGWWFDGCYWANSMYRHPDPPNFASFANAARSGNPNSALAFNPGVYTRLRPLTSSDDYMAGEINDPDTVDARRAENGVYDGVQIHVLSYLGRTWGRGNPRFATEDVVKWSLERTKNGGVITWDTPIQPSGLVSEPFMEQLRAIGKALNER